MKGRVLIANDADIIRPILIARGFADELRDGCKYWNLSQRKPLLFNYEAINNRDIKFEEVSHD